MESEMQSENRHNPLAAPVSMEWRVLAAICVVTSGLLVFALLSLGSALQPTYGIVFGDMPLPEVTMMILAHGYWAKWAWETILLGIAVWILRSKKTIPFFYGAIALMVTNLLVLVIELGIIIPFVNVCPLYA